MKIAILSGKGGTGKTFLAVNLAASAKYSTIIDCDVEEPNVHLFLKTENTSTKNVSVKIPYVLEQLCDGQRKCVDFCRYNALAYIDNQLIVMDNLCHSCGGCLLVCPNKALKEKNKVIGEISSGKIKQINVLSGFLKPGEATGVPIIKELLDDSNAFEGLKFIDCPPGSSCSVIESIKSADFCLLVTEPTILGAFNLKTIYELTKLFNKLCAVVINKSEKKTNPAQLFCRQNKITILENILFDRTMNDISSIGKVLVWENKRYLKLFTNLLNNLVLEARK